MIKSELASAVAAKAGITKKMAAKAVDSVFDTIAASLADGDSVKIAGFGTFEVRPRAERKGRNPRTKETVMIPASRVPAFKAAKHLKDQM